MGPRVLVCFLGLLTAGCHQQMAEQPQAHRPLAPSGFFADGRSSRPAVEGTVARGQLRDDAHLETGRAGDDFATTFPFEVTEAVLKRGRERYDIFCAVCHDRAGTGRGIVVRRGFSDPPNLAEDLSRRFRIEGRDLPLREAPVGYLFDVVTNGFGSMPSFATEVPVRDRWAIVAHVRVLQLSQHLRLDELPPEEREFHFPKGGGR